VAVEVAALVAAGGGMPYTTYTNRWGSSGSLVAEESGVILWFRRCHLAAAERREVDFVRLLIVKG
jgi:hypothetical protein